MSTDITDYAPVGIVDDRDILFTTLRSGELAATLSAIDTGPLTGGRWIIDAQSHAGLFGIAYDPATDTQARLVVNDAASLPQAGSGVSVTVHYYDRYQLDSAGRPLAGKGIAETLVYTVEAGSSQDLAGFGADLALGSASAGGSPALASLLDGSFAAVWQAPGGALWAQARDAGGAPLGASFLLAASGAAPALAALDAGRFVAAYTTNDGHIGWRIAAAGGSAGPAFAAGSAGSAMPDVAVLDDGSIALAWCSAGQVHVQRLDPSGTPLGTEGVFGSLGTAFSPSITAVGNGYALSWGEIGDGNVYAALPGGATVQVTSDGLAASLSTAAPLPEIAQLADGSFVVAWDSYANEPYGFTISDIFFQRFDAAGNALGAITQANLDSGGGRYAAKLAALSEGGFLLAWQAQGGDFDGNGVFGRRFGADGNALDAREFGINEGRAGDQAAPALAALAHGGFAAAWIDTQAGGAAQLEARVLAGMAPVQPPAPVVTAPTPAPAVTLPAPVVVVPAPEPVVPAPPPVVVFPTPEPVVPAPPPVVVVPAPAPAPVTPAPSVPVTPPVVSTPVPPVTAPLPRTELTGRAGADLIHAGSAPANQRIDGLDGLDTVGYAGVRSGFTLAHGAGGVSVTGPSGASDLLVNVERIAFADAAVALDIIGTAGQAYRLYAAAFDRAPDRAGLGYWIGMMDGGLKLEQAAAAFAGSAEFAGLYGANASDARFVELLYDNVLHRAAEGAGRQFWIDALAQHGVSRAQVLAQFSESAENQAQVIGAIENGIDFIPWA